MVVQHKRFLLGLFLLSLTLRLLMFFTFTQHGSNAWIYFDSNQYYTIAKQLCAGNGICMQEGIAQYYRLPGYSLFLAGLLQFFQQNVWYALLVQTIVMSLIPLLCFVLVLSIFPANVMLARLTALGVAVNLGMVLYAGMIATEPLCLIFMLLFFIAYLPVVLGTTFFCHPELVSGSIRINTKLLALSALAGAFLGCASLIRPVGHYVLPLAIALVLLVSALRWRQKLLYSTGLLSGWLAIVSWWLLRNYLLTGAIFFHSLPGLHFLQYTGANIIMQRDGCTYLQARSAILQEWERHNKQAEVIQQKSLNEYERCVVGEALAKQYIKSYPLYALKYSLVQLFKTCVALYSTHILLADTGVWPAYDQNTSWWFKVKRFLVPELAHPWLVVWVYLELLLTMLMAVGLLLFCLSLWSMSGQERMTWLVLALFAGLFIGLTIAYGCARLRMPCEPLLLMAASRGWLWLVSEHTEVHCEEEHG